jgi:predicted dinucleotide-binding enzyme
MRNLLLQLDTSPHPSVFDRVVALDSGADEVMSYGGVSPENVRDMVHGAIFTRKPKELQHTAIFIGGTDMTAGERVLQAVQSSFFGPFRVSVMLDSNGSNTTAVAAVVKLLEAAGSAPAQRAVVTAATGPVGMRAAGLLARAGVQVTITSRRLDQAEHAAERIKERFGPTVHPVAMADASHA